MTHPGQGPHPLAAIAASMASLSVLISPVYSWPVLGHLADDAGVLAWQTPCPFDVAHWLMRVGVGRAGRLFFFFFLVADDPEKMQHTHLKPRAAWHPYLGKVQVLDLQMAYPYGTHYLGIQGALEIYFQVQFESHT